MDTSQLHTLDSQRMALNYVSHVLTKATSIRPMYFLPLSNEQASILTWDQARPVQLGQLTLFTKVRQRSLYLIEQPPVSQEVICSWPRGAYGLEAFLFYRLLNTVI